MSNRIACLALFAAFLAGCLPIRERRSDGGAQQQVNECEEEKEKLWQENQRLKRENLNLRFGVSQPKRERHDAVSQEESDE